MSYELRTTGQIASLLAAIPVPLTPMERILGTAAGAAWHTLQMRS